MQETKSLGLTRKEGQTLVVTASNGEKTVLQFHGRVSVTVRAPESVQISRGEIHRMTDIIPVA